jgi:hypothetical protein
VVLPGYTLRGVLTCSVSFLWQIWLASVEGPLVNAHVVVPTECESDDGLPHTLEHLVFLGSEEFPYKGVLDKVANRAFATGTNAYTDVHHTAYTLTTAGSEGALSLLPVFLDHIVYPTITESGFVTEVSTSSVHSRDLSVCLHSRGIHPLPEDSGRVYSTHGTRSGHVR